MRLGGFVIHGNNRDTLPRCLDSLLAVCDEVVAVDSQSTDGSAELVRARGLRSVSTPWRGYGAARAEAVRLLPDADYLFYLDSDEWVEADGLERLRRWRQGAPRHPLYTVKRRNWAELETRRFVFFTDTRARLVRRDAARWTPDMIVHEALPPLPSGSTGAHIEHTFATSVDDRSAKDDRYALLWAIRFAAQGTRMKPPGLQRWAHLFRNLVLHGALFRGAAAGARLSASVARYHARKYEYLRAVRAGEYRELVEAFERGELERVIRLAAEQS